MLNALVNNLDSLKNEDENIGEYIASMDNSEYHKLDIPLSIEGKKTFLQSLNQKKSSLHKWNQECQEFITGYCYGFGAIVRKTVQQLEALKQTMNNNREIIMTIDLDGILKKYLPKPVKINDSYTRRTRRHLQHDVSKNGKSSFKKKKNHRENSYTSKNPVGVENSNDTASSLELDTSPAGNIESSEPQIDEDSSV